MTTTTTELTVADAAGVWAIRSESATVYLFDADAGRMLRQPGDGSSRGAWDDCWVPLVKVDSESTPGAIRVGERHRWLTDPEPGARDYGGRCSGGASRSSLCRPMTCRLVASRIRMRAGGCRGDGSTTTVERGRPRVTPRRVRGTVTR